jgi:type II secretory pathway component PulK
MNNRPINVYEPGRRNTGRGPGRATGHSGSVLIVVMWIAFGVVSMALYFAHSMQMRLREVDNQVASMEADQAIESAAIYYSNVLAGVMQLSQQFNAQGNFAPFMLPSTNFYSTAGVKVGSARFWVIGRDTNDSVFSRRSPDPSFGLVDESSKIHLWNLNNTKLYGISPDSTTQTNLLFNLPRMTLPLLSCIYDWATSNTTACMNGAKDTTYEGLNPPYMCKMTNFDTVGELRMVYGMTLDYMYGEDANLNGALDPNENDGPLLPPNDNADGTLDPGLLEYFTVYTQEPTVIGATSQTPTNRQVVTSLSGLTNFIATNFPNVYSDIAPNLRGMTAPKSVLEFAMRSGITQSDLAIIEPYLMNSTNTLGLINVNTATATVLGCLPGIGNDGVMGIGSQNAQTVIQYRQSNPSEMNSVYWLLDALQSIGSGNVTNLVTQVGPYITSHSWQYSADVVAVGHNGRGYRRVKFVYDCSSGVPLIVFRQDLTYLGWALGKKIHDQLLAGNYK